MAQSSQVEIHRVSDGRFWTDGWDGYPAARQRLLDTLRASGAANPIVLSGDVHTFYAAELRRDPTGPARAGNPVVAREVLTRFHRYNSEDAAALQKLRRGDSAPSPRRKSRR